MIETEMAVDHLSDEEIVQRVQSGETQLFAALFDRHYPRLERFVRRLGLRDADLEDVLADTFARAFRGIGSFNADGGAKYISYLYAITRNLVTDKRREQARMPQMELIEEAYSESDPNAPSPVESVLWREQVDAVKEAMTRLSDSDREIILLSYDRELSSREIMGVMDKPSITSVTTHLYKAIQKLRSLAARTGQTGQAAHSKA